jgi:hypothetical protein
MGLTVCRHRHTSSMSLSHDNQVSRFEQLPLRHSLSLCPAIRTSAVPTRCRRSDKLPEHFRTAYITFHTKYHASRHIACRSKQIIEPSGHRVGQPHQTFVCISRWSEGGSQGAEKVRCKLRCLVPPRNTLNLIQITTKQRVSEGF